MFTTPTRLWLVYFKPNANPLERGHLHVSQVRRYREDTYAAHKEAADSPSGYEPAMRLAYHIFLALVTHIREQAAEKQQYWRKIHPQIYQRLRPFPASVILDSAGRSHTLRILDKPWPSASCDVFLASMDDRRTVVVKIAWDEEAWKRIRTESRLSRKLKGLRGVVEYVGGLYTFNGRPAVITAFAGAPIRGFGDLTPKQR
jgi:hypothetical protein